MKIEELRVLLGDLQNSKQKVAERQNEFNQALAQAKSQFLHVKAEAEHEYGQYSEDACDCKATCIDDVISVSEAYGMSEEVLSLNVGEYLRVDNDSLIVRIN